MVIGDDKPRPTPLPPFASRPAVRYLACYVAGRMSASDSFEIRVLSPGRNPLTQRQRPMFPGLTPSNPKSLDGSSPTVGVQIRDSTGSIVFSVHPSKHAGNSIVRFAQDCVLVRLYG